MSETSLREQKQLQRKARVIESAMRLAASGGYDAVQMREVAADADVAMGTIYRYYSSKDAVLVAGLAGWVGMARSAIDGGPGEDASPAGRLISVLDASVTATVRQPRLMEALITALASTEPQVAEYKNAVHQEMSGMVADALAGYDGIDVDGVCRVMGHVWFSAIVGWVGGMRPASSVMEELELAARLLLD